MHGITLRAVMVLAPRSRTESNVGQYALLNASGRTPSSMIKATGGMIDSFSYKFTVVSTLRLNHRFLSECYSINEIKLLSTTFDIRSPLCWLHSDQNTFGHTPHNQNPIWRRRPAPRPTWLRADQT